MYPVEKSLLSSGLVSTTSFINSMSDWLGKLVKLHEPNISPTNIQNIIRVGSKISIWSLNIILTPLKAIKLKNKAGRTNSLETKRAGMRVAIAAKNIFLSVLIAPIKNITVRPKYIIDTKLWCSCIMGLGKKNQKNDSLYFSGIIMLIA